MSAERSGQGRSQSRGRGRPRGGDPARTRQTIIDVARSQFADRGFRGTSVRSIAGAAGVDPSLINHHFGDKANLLVATMTLPFNPLEKITGVLDGPLDGLGARLVRTFCESWDPHRDVFTAAVRSTFDGRLENAPLLNFAQVVVTERFTARLEGPDGQLRASLIASQLTGLALMRYVARIEPLASTCVDDVVAAYAPALQANITPEI